MPFNWIFFFLPDLERPRLGRALAVFEHLLPCHSHQKLLYSVLIHGCLVPHYRLTFGAEPSLGVYKAHDPPLLPPQ